MFRSKILIFLRDFYSIPKMIVKKKIKILNDTQELTLKQGSKVLIEYFLRTKTKS